MKLKNIKFEKCIFQLWAFFSTHFQLLLLNLDPVKNFSLHGFTNKNQFLIAYKKKKNNEKMSILRIFYRY